MRRRLFPMPIEALADSELAMTFPAAVYGMLTRLMVHYASTGCAPLPIADHELQHIARAHKPTWRRWKPQLMQALQAILPEIEAYHAFRMQRRGQLKIASWSGGARRAAVASANRLQQSTAPLAPDITSFHQLGHVPHREPAPPRPQTPDKRPPRPIRTDTLPRR
jgi:hypothetical protein